MRALRLHTCLRSSPSPSGRGWREAPGEGGKCPRTNVLLPSSGASRHLLPEGEGLAYRLFCVCVLPLLLFGCVKTDYLFEQVDGSQPVSLPLKFEGLYGVRDGATVKAEARFVNGADVVTMNLVVFLRPPAEFQSGTYQASIGGKTSSGTVECPSLAFQGGQTALPSMGGTFILKSQDSRPLYRIRIPATQLRGSAAR